jgi:hypothetical protein
MNQDHSVDLYVVLVVKDKNPSGDIGVNRITRMILRKMPLRDRKIY